MNDVGALFRELKPDVERVSSPLFDFAQQQVRKTGGFLPFGSTLSPTGEVSLHAGSTGSDEASSLDILPILHDGLREAATAANASALAVCEWVKIAPDGGSQTDAIKVLVEHRRGLVIALYIPCKRRLLGWRFGDMLAIPAEAEVKAWVLGAA